jgi:hypothetical protein
VASHPHARLGAPSRSINCRGRSAPSSQRRGSCSDGGLWRQFAATAGHTSPADGCTGGAFPSTGGWRRRQQRRRGPQVGRRPAPQPLTLITELNVCFKVQRVRWLHAWPGSHAGLPPQQAVIPRFCRSLCTCCSTGGSHTALPQVLPPPFPTAGGAWMRTECRQRFPTAPLPCGAGEGV